MNLKKSIEEVSCENFEIVIIATSSDIRADIIKKLLKLKVVKYMIIEKFLFQNKTDYLDILKILKEKNIKAWVNSPRRTWEFYKYLKKMLNGDTVISAMIQGGDWGMACNSIHYLDCFIYLNECLDFKIYNEGLDDKIYNSKRNGYIEFGGTLRIKFSNDSELIIKDNKNFKTPGLVNIQTKNIQVVFYESTGEVIFNKIENSWKMEMQKFEIPFQSNLTNIFIQDIVNFGNCELISYEESMKIHLKLLESFIEKAEQITKEKITNCNIT